MTRLALAASALALLSPQVSTAQTCQDSDVKFGWTQPPRIPIEADEATRWPTDATIRVGLGGVWQPQAEQVKLVRLEASGETPVPAQVRFKAAHGLVQNGALPLTLMEVDPVEALAERADYRLVLSPPNPALPLFTDYALEFRTLGRAADPIPDFEGIRAVALAADRCDANSCFVNTNDADPTCVTPAYLRLAVTFQPLDRADVTYELWRTASGETAEPIPVLFQPGLRTTQPLTVTLETLYGPLPRRECYSVRVVDEWGRERGGADAESCVELLPLETCPGGLPFPEPPAAAVNAPILGDDPPNVGLYGADPERPIPPIGQEDAGVDGGLADASDSPDGGSGGGDGGGCAVSPAHRGALPWGLGLLALVALWRRRRA